jgi:hypothetical protein
VSGRIFLSSNLLRQTRAPAGPALDVQPQDISDQEALARLLTRHAIALGAARELARPPYVEFEDVDVPAAGSVRLPHGLHGRVRWWVTDWTSAGPAPVLRRDASATDADTLVLVSAQAGTATIRCEALP